MTPETVECLERVLRHGIGILRAVEDWLRKQREALGMPSAHAQQPPPNRRP